MYIYVVFFYKLQLWFIQGSLTLEDMAVRVQSWRTFTSQLQEHVFGAEKLLRCNYKSTCSAAHHGERWDHSDNRALLQAGADGWYQLTAGGGALDELGLYDYIWVSHIGKSRQQGSPFVSQSIIRVYSVADIFHHNSLEENGFQQRFSTSFSVQIKSYLCSFSLRESAVDEQKAFAAVTGLCQSKSSGKGVGVWLTTSFPYARGILQRCLSFRSSSLTQTFWIRNLPSLCPWHRKKKFEIVDLPKLQFRFSILMKSLMNAFKDTVFFSSCYLNSIILQPCNQAPGIIWGRRKRLRGL